MVLWGLERSFLPLLQGSFLPPQAPEPRSVLPNLNPTAGRLGTARGLGGPWPWWQSLEKTRIRVRDKRKGVASRDGSRIES